MAQNSKGIAKGLVKLLVVMSLVLSILAVLATQLQIRVYNIYNQIQVFTQIDQNTLYIISMALPFFALAIT